MEFGVGFYIWPVILIKFNHLLFYGRMCVCVFLLNVSTHNIYEFLTLPKYYTKSWISYMWFFLKLPACSLFTGS